MCQQHAEPHRSRWWSSCGPDTGCRDSTLALGEVCAQKRACFTQTVLPRSARRWSWTWQHSHHLLLQSPSSAQAPTSLSKRRYLQLDNPTGMGRRTLSFPNETGRLLCPSRAHQLYDCEGAVLCCAIMGVGSIQNPPS